MRLDDWVYIEIEKPFNGEFVYVANICSRKVAIALYDSYNKTFMHSKSYPRFKITHWKSIVLPKAPEVDDGK